MPSAIVAAPQPYVCELVLARHRIQQDRDRPRFFYLIASGAGEEKEIDLNIEESLWFELSDHHHHVLPFVFNAIFIHEQHRILVQDEKIAQITYTPYTGTLEELLANHSMFCKRLEFAIKHGGLAVQRGAKPQSGPSILRAEPRPRQYSARALFGKADVPAGAGEASMVFYAGWDIDVTERGRDNVTWFNEDTLPAEEAITFSVNAIDLVGSTPFKSPLIAHVAYLVDIPKELDPESVTAKLVGMIRQDYPRLVRERNR